jgi:hypothetical protein
MSVRQQSNEAAKYNVYTQTKLSTTINAVDILVIDLYALHIRTIDAFKSSENLKTAF